MIQNYGRVHDATSVIVFDSNKDVRVTQTFEAYPYDKVPQKALDAFPYHLDHIFVRGFIHAPPTTQRHHVIQFRGMKYGVSDHLPILLKLQ